MMEDTSLYLETLKSGSFRVERDFWFGGYFVPAGYVTDMDSVPRLPLTYAWFKGRTTKAAVVHDYLYKTKSFLREEADKIFLELMEREGVKKRYRIPIYWAVRLFGSSHY